MKIVVVIPTYNEVENVSKLIPALIDELEQFKHHDFHILVVDGNSPDGTGKKVSEMHARFPNVHLLTEKEKAGLGAAYVYGFNHAIKELGAEAIVEMDADFQHSPQDLVKIIRVFDEGADYVLGSRYTKGGSIP